MDKFKFFEVCRISQPSLVCGSGNPTGGGSKYGFDYDSDYSTWNEGSEEWEISYYGIKTCAC